MHCDKAKETCADVLTPHERVIGLLSYIYNFSTGRMNGGDDALYLKFWAKLTPMEQKKADCRLIFARIAPQP